MSVIFVHVLPPRIFIVVIVVTIVITVALDRSHSTLPGSYSRGDAWVVAGSQRAEGRKAKQGEEREEKIQEGEEGGGREKCTRRRWKCCQE